MKGIYIIMLCSFLGIYSCGNDSTNSSKVEGGYTVTVTAAAGSDFIRDSLAYLTIPYNEASFKKIDSDKVTCAVLTNQLNARSKINVRPIAMMDYIEENIEKHCIIAIPLDSMQNILEVHNFSDFMLKHAPVRNIIELWQLNRCGSGCAKLLGWKDENATQLHLERLLNQ